MKKLLIITALLIISVGLFSQNNVVSNKVLTQQALGNYWTNTISTNYITLTASRQWRISPITNFLGDSTLLKSLVANGSGLFKTSLSCWGNTHLGNSASDTTYNSGMFKIGRGLVINDNVTNATTDIIDTVPGQIMDIGVKNNHSASLYNGVEINDLTSKGLLLIGGGSALTNLSDVLCDITPPVKVTSLEATDNVTLRDTNTFGDYPTDLNTLNGKTTINYLAVWTDTLYLTKYTWHTSSATAGIINSDSTFVFYYKFPSATDATIRANSIGSHLVCWYNGTTLKKGFVSYAITAGDTVKYVIYGARYVAGDKTFRFSVVEKIQTWEFFIPGEILADSTSDLGMEHVKRFGDTLQFIGCSAYLKVAAAGAGADFRFGLYSNTFNAAMSAATKLTDVSNTYTSFAGNAVLTNIITSQPLISGRSRVTFRPIVSAGATNKANGCNVMMYYAQKDLFDSIP